MLAVIVDPTSNTAAWTDISEYLRQRPSLITDGPFTIAASQRFDAASFADFRSHCLHYRDQYSREPNFGRALKSFSDLDDKQRCYDGLRALFAYHRQQKAMWFYVVSCLSNFAGHPVLRPLVLCLSHVPGHSDIFWHGRNVIEEDVRKYARKLMQKRFDRRDALTMLSVIDEAGVERGSVGQSVHALVDTIADTQAVMQSIAMDVHQTERVRHTATLFAVTAAQSVSVGNALSVVDRIRCAVDRDSELQAVLSWLTGDLREAGYVSLY